MVEMSAVYQSAHLLEAQFPGITQRPKDSFSVQVNFLPATANATTTQNAVVSQDADFVWCATTFDAFNTDNLTVVSNPSFLISYTDTSSGRQLQSGSTPLVNVGGTGQNAFVLFWPQILLRGTTLTVSVQNLDPANDRNVRVTLAGYKVYGSPLLNTRR